MSSFIATNTAPVKWAQRKDSLYVTIALADVIDSDIQLTDKKLTFSGKSDGKNYAVELEFVSIYEIFIRLLGYSFNIYIHSDS